MPNSFQNAEVDYMGNQKRQQFSNNPFQISTKGADRIGLTLEESKMELQVVEATNNNFHHCMKESIN